MVQSSSEKIIKQNLDLLVLSMLDKKATHGYDLISEFHNVFNILLSPGTLYPVLYNMESMKFLKAENLGKARKYSVTELGKRELDNESMVFKKTSVKIEQYLNRNGSVSSDSAPYEVITDN